MQIYFALKSTQYFLLLGAPENPLFMDGHYLTVIITRSPIAEYAAKGVGGFKIHSCNVGIAKATFSCLIVNCMAVQTKINPILITYWDH